MLLTGGLAVAAGAVASVVAPQVAAANNGDPVLSGDLVYGRTTMLMGTTTGTSAGTLISQARFNAGLGTYPADPVYGTHGAITADAPATSAGVYGDAYKWSTYGVHANHRSNAGTALKVTGRVALSRSGTATIAKKHSSLTVTVPSGVDVTSTILATLQGSGGKGVVLRYAKRMSPTTFKVALNKKATSAVTFAWMILG
jgi:hypothetical protein